MKTIKRLNILAALAFFLTSPLTGEQFSVETTNIGFSPEHDPIPLSQRFLNHLQNFNHSAFLSRGSGIEPTLAVNPRSEKQLVACWAQDPYFTLPGFGNLGGMDAGIAFTKRDGKRWHHTLVPFSRSLGGFSPLVDNLWADYSIDGKYVYLTGIVYSFGGDSKICVTRSKNNGLKWDVPKFIATRLNQTDDYDKPSVTADRNEKNNAYIVCDDAYQDDDNPNYSVAVISRTTDQGKHWSPFKLLYDPFPDLTATGLGDGIIDDCSVINNIIIVMPKKNKSPVSGDLLNFMTRLYYTPEGNLAGDISYVRSHNQGRTWDTQATLVTPLAFQFDSALFDTLFPGGYTYDSNGNIIGGIGSSEFFAPIELFSVAIHPKNGFIYVTWIDLVLTHPQTPQIAMTSSRDGGKTWSTPVRINQTPLDAINSQAYAPFIAVTKEGYVGVLYNDFRFDNRSDLSNTKTDVWLAIYQEVSNPLGGSTGAGLTFVEEHRLTETSFILQNAPPAGSFGGVSYPQNGDYSFLRAGRKNFYAVYFKDFNGPFSPFTNLISNPGVFLDSNYRNAPFVSVIKRK